MAKRNYRVIIAPEARDELRKELAYIRRSFSDQRARHVNKGLQESIRSLDTFPERHGKLERINTPHRTYRYLPKWSFMIIYRVDESALQVRVVSVFNTNQDDAKIDLIAGR